MQKVTSERGLSLVEATIILMVLSILTAVIAPTIGDYVNDARDVKAKEDVEAIGGGVLRLVRDARQACLLLDASSASCTLTNRVDVLTTDGAEPVVSAALHYLIENTAMTAGGGGAINFFGSTEETAQFDTAENQLVKNTPNGAAANAYANPTTFYTAGGPQAGIGWRGAYMSAPIGPDPWGNMYQANTGFLNVVNDVAGTDEGESSGGWRHDAFVISAGRNGIIETPFADAGGTGGVANNGDDVIYIMTGSTR